MSINSMTNYRAALRETVLFRKGPAAAVTFTTWYSMWNLGAIPAAGGAIGNTTTGLVPVAGTGSPMIQFSTGSGYITGVEFTANAVCRILLYDRLWHAGPFTSPNTTALGSQPSYSARVPGGDYSSTFAFLESSGNTGLSTYASHLTYTDQSGNTGHVGADSSGLSPQINATEPYLLASGDSGIQTVESVVCATSTGSYNVVVGRPLWLGRIKASNRSHSQSLAGCGMPLIFNTSCLCLLVVGDNQSNPTVEAQFEIASL